jgi:hypothetical protein
MNWAISYYYKTNDRCIKFKKDVPEITFFFDVDPKNTDILKNDKKFVDIIRRLENTGFESNLNEQLTDNTWRLLIYRKSIIDFEVINLNEIIMFTDNVISLLKNCDAFEHRYFNEFI